MSFADKFNLLNEFNILRIICGAFFLPHIIGKVTVPATLGFFVAAGFKPMWKAPTSVLCGISYGFIMYFVLEDLFVPILGVTSYQPLWEGLVGNVLFHGIVISEYITICFRRNVAQDA